MEYWHICVEGSLKVETPQFLPFRRVSKKKKLTNKQKKNTIEIHRNNNLLQYFINIAFYTGIQNWGEYICFIEVAANNVEKA